MSEVNKLMELWLEEFCRCKQEQQKEETRWEEERQRKEQKWKRKEEKWRWMEEERAQKSEKLMRTIVTYLAEREPQRPRHELGVDSLKLTKLTLSNEFEAFMTTFESLMEAHKIEHGKLPVLLGPQCTGKAQQAYAVLNSKGWSRRPYLSSITLIKNHTTIYFEQ